jgi:hypothetical protein
MWISWMFERETLGLVEEELVVVEEKSMECWQGGAWRVGMEDLGLVERGLACWKGV